MNSTYLENGTDTKMISTPLYMYLWVTFMNVAMFITGFFGNTLVIIVILRYKNMKTITNCCLLNLSMSDLLTLTICQTSALMEFFSHDRWILGEALCQMIPFLEILVTHASILIMLGISYGRYFAVCYPLESYSTCSRTRAFMMMASAWIFAGISAMPFIFMSHTETAKFTNDNTEVTVCRTHISQVWQRIFIVVSFIAFFVIPCFILAFVYSKTIYTVITESKKIENATNVSKQNSMKSRQQLVVMLLMIVILFFLFVLPMRIVILWLVFENPRTIGSLGFEGYYNIIWIARVLQYTNSAVNPIIYNVFSVKFRKAFAKLLFSSKRQTRQLSLTSSGGRTAIRYSFVKSSIKETEFH
ncbi:thyrotropin-releasing hormone receptor-like [Mytilus californianus]|uniref:thyrotropin-releasing hormone receptor-like n=1 Tax=Mytilus californianus TaxID=6549 RepID=UPI0022473A9A|nr:thyrotropin-releasing hormone receptor-like [Mytilus californianus]